MNPVASMRTTSATLIDEQNLQHFRATTGKNGLASLLAAIRNMLQMLLRPFRIVARVLYGSGNAGQTAASPPVSGGADFAPGTGNDAVTLPNSAQTDDAFASQVANGAGGTVSVELSGEQNELEGVLPMLQRHMELLLKEHLPADVNEFELRKRLTTLAESAERGQFAYWVGSRQVAKVLESLAGQPMYVGMSPQSIEEIVKSGAKTAAGRKLFAAGSAEESLMAKIGFRDQVAATYHDQLKQIARIVVRYDETTTVKPAQLLQLVRDSADVTREKLNAKFPEASANSQHSLEKIDVVLNRLMSWPNLESLKDQSKNDALVQESSVVVSAPDDASPASAVAEATSPADLAATAAGKVEEMKDAAPAGSTAPVAIAKAQTGSTGTAAAAGGMFGSMKRSPEAEKAASREAMSEIDDDFDSFAMG